MNIIQELQNKENMLAERASMLKSSIQKEKQELTEHNISAKADSIRSLEIQLSLTEKALENIQEKHREQREILNSKEYKDKLKMQEKLSKQAIKQAGEVFEELQELLKKVEEVESLAKQAGKLERETALDKSVLAYSSIKFRQPFSWLYGLKLTLHKQVENGKLIKNKLEV